MDKHDPTHRIYYVVGMTIFVFIGFFQFLAWFKDLDRKRGMLKATELKQK